MARRGSSDTVAGLVHDRLRGDILAGRIPPGTRLKVMELREQLSASVSVVREALTRLTEQGLVVLETNLGFAVRQLSASNLRDLTEIRTRLEPYALQLSIERGSVEWEAAVLSAHHILASTPRQLTPGLPRNPEWTAAHRQFHLQLLAGCGNDSLLALCEMNWDSAELFRLWSTAAPGERSVEDEHRELTGAVIERDAARAARLLNSHIQRTAERVIQAKVQAVEARLEPTL